MSAWNGMVDAGKIRLLMPLHARWISFDCYDQHLRSYSFSYFYHKTHHPPYGRILSVEECASALLFEVSSLLEMGIRIVKVHILSLKFMW